MQDDEGDGNVPKFDNPVPAIAKNKFAPKIFLPYTIKLGLQQQATLAPLPAGRSMQSMIFAHLLGQNVEVKAALGQRGRATI